MPRQHRVSAVADVRRQRRAGTDRIANLLRTRPSVPDADHYAVAHHLFDNSRSPGPSGRQCQQTDVPLSRVLKSPELVEIGCADPALRMRAARTVIGRNVRAFNMKRL